MAPISFRNVRKNYGGNAIIHGVDLEIEDGQFVVILGPSGCGKSTLLRMIAGLEEITAGEIAIAGRVVNALEPRERGCAMVFQNYALYPHMTVAANIGYALKVARVPRAERQARVAKVAATLGLTDYLDRRPGALSGGQRQRVAMGRAMIREPEVFLYDEPLSNLDAKLRVQMRVEIRRLHQRLGSTSVFVTHDQVEAMTLADKIVVLNQGRVEQVGSSNEIYHRPATRFVADFIGAPPMNIMRATVCGPSSVDIDGLALDTPRLFHDRGAPIDVGFRPEDIVITGAAHPGAIPFQVDFVEDLGSTRLVHGSIGSAPASVMASGDVVGARKQIHLAIPPESVHLFDAVTGRRIETQELSVAAE